jgi:hypothetical protein
MIDKDHGILPDASAEGPSVDTLYVGAVKSVSVAMVREDRDICKFITSRQWV